MRKCICGRQYPDRIKRTWPERRVILGKIQKLRRHVTVADACRLLGIGTASYYDWLEQEGDHR